MIQSIETPECACPMCSSKLDMVSASTEAPPPAEGSITICLYCQTPLRFNADMKLEKITEKDFEEFDPEFRAEIARAQEDAAKVMKSLQQ